MKILFILHETSLFNGSWKSARVLLHGLRQAGDEVVVFAPDGEGAAAELRRDGFRVEYARNLWNASRIGRGFVERLKDIPRGWRRRLYERRWLKKGMQICRDFQPDIIHTNSSVFTSGLKLARKVGVPHVWHVREYGAKDFGLELKERAQLWSSNRWFVCITRGVRDELGLDKTPGAAVIYNGICPLSLLDSAAQPSASISPSLSSSPSSSPSFSSALELAANPAMPEDYFLFVGQLTEGKGVKDILDAWKEFSSETSHQLPALIFCGGTDEEICRWKRYIDEERIGGDIRFLGKRKDVGRLMAAARAVVVGSKAEAFGRVMPEALVASTLVIGRDTEGTHEQFENGLQLTGREIGLRFKGTPELLAALRRSMQLSAGERLSMIEAGRSTVKSLYTEEGCVAALRAFYKRVLETEDNPGDKPQDG